MTNDERKAYWDKLISLEGKDFESESKELVATIKYPKHLYRYRPISPRSLEALRTNKLYFSTSNYYDDPFDTLINVDIAELQDVITKLREPGLDVKQIFSESFKQLEIDNILESIPESEMEEFAAKIKEPMFCEDVTNYFRNIRNELKKDIWSVCFSENGCNEVLWLKYAQQHKGFAVRYDLEKPELQRRRKEEKYSDYGFGTRGITLFPMYYSADMYNGTRFAQYLAIAKMFQLDDAAKTLISSHMGISSWEYLKLTTIKRECHKYDEEWRMILNGTMKGPVSQEWIPGAIILGLNMNQENRQLVSALAKDAGIKEIYHCVISDKGTLELKNWSEGDN